MKNSEIWIAALAGLTHDIGKFALRAGVSGTRTWDTLAEQDYGYKHALLSEDVISQYLPAAWKPNILRAAGSHHRPGNALGYAVALADRLSAGERADPESGDRMLQPQQLLSIFCILKADGQQVPERQFWPLEELRMTEEAIFPIAPLKGEQVWRRYESLWQRFCQQAGELKTAHENANTEDDFNNYLESMVQLLQRFTWAIPAAYYHAEPDISLYDHGRMTAALAALLISSGFSETDLRQMKNRPEQVDQDLALLVGGDFTGVQDFIYTISDRGATSALRGRSFYLTLLTQAAARFILRELDLPITNLIYAGGGNFYLLARPSDRDHLAQIQSRISRILLRQHHGDLYLALGSVPLKGNHFFNGLIRARWKDLAEILNQAKTRKFSELGNELPQLFKPQGVGGNEEKLCQVCQTEHPGTEGIERSEDGTEIRKCPPCVSYETLGDQLRRSAFLQIEFIQAQELPAEDEPPARWPEVMECLGLRVQPLDNLTGQERGLILALRDSGLDQLQPRQGIIPGRAWVVNVTPILKEADQTELRDRITGLPVVGSIKPFNAMAEQAGGVKRLGVLRMDMDNVGHLFAEGLGDKATLSRLASLSFTISLFFEGWVGRLAETVNLGDSPGGGRIYSIYSGGDDLFFVGAWDQVIELARQIRRDLGRYAANHPGIHASAGIVLADGKEPLALAAHSAQTAEDAAKSVRWSDNGVLRQKDGICFLGQALPWRTFGLEECADQKQPTAHALMHTLKNQLEAGAPHSLVRRLSQFYELYTEQAEKRRQEGNDRTQTGQDQALWGPWNWRVEYILARMGEKGKNIDIQALRDRLRKDQFRSIEWIGLAARWAELLTRN